MDGKLMLQPAPRTVKLLLVEDDADQRDLLEFWLSKSGYCVTIARDGFEALAITREQAFDIILTDLRLPGLNGLQLLKLVKEHDPSVLVIFLSAHGTMEDAIAALREWGAFDFLHKPLHNFRQLNLVIEKALLQRQASQVVGSSCDCQEEACPIDVLSARELELARLLVKGCGTKAIAGHLGLSEKTVRNKLSQLYEKLGVKNRSQAMLMCLNYRLH